LQANLSILKDIKEIIVVILRFFKGWHINYEEKRLVGGIIIASIPAVFFGYFCIYEEIIDVGCNGSFIEFIRSNVRSKRR
jgi:hypothetical protein